ncbi:MAG: hypothetical protein PHO66_07655, partial [Eubacteriales bacterium]|nr:hypothetical protein [Eubacteriales bacterium]
YFDYILSHETGIYYLYHRVLLQLPAVFASREASRYLTAIELLSRYPNAYVRQKLAFVAAWLESNRLQDGLWDMGGAVRDGVQFPLSDCWRSARTRRDDCTYRIARLLEALGRG